MTVEEVKLELEQIVAKLVASGFGNVDPSVLGKLDQLTEAAGNLSMNEGKRLIENLVKEMKSAKEGEARKKSCNVRLMALDFYLRKLSSSSGKTED